MGWAYFNLPPGYKVTLPAATQAKVDNWHGNVINNTAGNLPPQTSGQQAAMITNTGLGTVTGFLAGGPVGAFGGFWGGAWGTAADQSFGITGAVNNIIQDIESPYEYNAIEHQPGDTGSGPDYDSWGGYSSVSNENSWF